MCDMVYGPLGYSGVLNILGILLQLAGFVMLLTQSKKWIERIGKKIGDSAKEIKSTNILLTKGGIYFVILGTASQLLSALLNAYAPNLFSNIP